MHTIILTPTNGQPYTFDGDILVHERGRQQDSITEGRCHDLVIYRNVDGNFVLEITYRSSCQNERNNTEIALVDSAKNIELVLQMYQPNEYVDRANLRCMNNEVRKRLMVQLFGNYDRQVAKVLASLQELGIRIEHDLDDADPQANRWKRLFNFFMPTQKDSLSN